jgi:DNA-binding transcriptional MerR regulator
MTMRMQELADRSGLPKTAIHHYAREGLLPPAHKTAPNAARYDETHLERLSLIIRLRADGRDGRPLSIPEIRRVLEHVDAGADLRVAVRLVEEGVEPEPAKVGTWKTSAELAAAGGLATEFIEALVTARLVGGGRNEAPFTPADLLAARACRAVCANRGIDPADLTPLADLLREVGNYSSTLMEVHAVRAGDPADDPASANPPAGRLERDLAALCDVLLWRVMQA